MLPITVLIAARNEQANLPRCLAALAPATAVVLLDSHSTDRTAAIAREHGASVVQFDYHGGYPKKRQWALDTLPIATDWILLLDADEVVPPALWDEIRDALARNSADAYLITKEFHFLGRKFRWGGFSHAAVLLVRRGIARFEHLLDEPAGSLDMEIHERLIVNGRIARLQTPVIHEDFKGLDSYRAKHMAYAEWEARVRTHFLATGTWGHDAVRASPFGNLQERRRWLKACAIRLPGEPLAWFLYHYLVRLGLLEGRRGLTACLIRAHYIARVRQRVNELKTETADER